MSDKFALPTPLEIQDYQLKEGSFVVSGAILECKKGRPDHPFQLVAAYRGANTGFDIKAMDIDRAEGNFDNRPSSENVKCNLTGMKCVFTQVENKCALVSDSLGHLTIKTTDIRGNRRIEITPTFKEEMKIYPLLLESNLLCYAGLALITIKENGQNQTLNVDMMKQMIAWINTDSKNHGMYLDFIDYNLLDAGGKNIYLDITYRQAAKIDMNNLQDNDTKVINRIAKVTGYDYDTSGRNIREFNRAFNDVGIDHSAKIFAMVCVTPERERNIFFGFLEELEIRNFAQYPDQATIHIVEDNLGRTYNSPFFSGDNKSIYMEFDDVLFSDYPANNRYEIFFHEYGHLADFASGDGGYLSAGPKYGEAMHTAIVADTERHLTGVGYELAIINNFDNALVPQGVARTLGGEQIHDKPLPVASTSDKITFEMQNKIRYDNNITTNVRDAFYSGSKNGLQPKAGSHVGDYWQNADGTPNYSHIGSEGFSGSFTANSRNDSTKITSQNTYLLSTKPLLEDLSNEISENGKGRLGL